MSTRADRDALVTLAYAAQDACSTHAALDSLVRDEGRCAAGDLLLGLAAVRCDEYSDIEIRDDEEIIADALTDHDRVQSARARIDGFIWPSGAAPDWREFADADIDELRAALTDPDDLGTAPTDAGPDGNWRRAFDGERASVESAIVALERGERVRVAIDDDGRWFAWQVAS